MRAAFTIALALSSLAGCSTVPKLSEVTGTEHSDILIGDIVRRVKCEIADAFIDKVNDPRFYWLATWTATVDLTLQVNNQAGVTPSVGYTNYYHNVFNKDAGSTSLTSTVYAAVNQTFGFGAAANYGEQAVRTEVITFSLSIREIKDQAARANSTRGLFVNNALCAPTDLPELRGGLGLREWVDSALFPVAHTDLQAGDHPSPGAKKPQGPTNPIGKATPITGASTFSFTFDKTPPPPQIPFSEAYRRLEAANDVARKLGEYPKIDKATVEVNEVADKLAAIASIISHPVNEWEPKQQLKIQEAIPYYPVLTTVFKTTIKTTITDYINKIEKQKISLSEYDGHKKHYDDAKAAAIDAFRDIDRRKTSAAAPATYPESIVTDVEGWLKEAQTSRKFYTDVAPGDTAALAGLKAFKPNPPVDALLHYVQFTVAYGASVTPSWSLINWKGPAPTGTLAAGSGNRSNTLQIALGDNPADQKRLINNQLLSSLPRPSGP